jgi:hypothetical protein
LPRVNGDTGDAGESPHVYGEAVRDPKRPWRDTSPSSPRTGGINYIEPSQLDAWGTRQGKRPDGDEPPQLPDLDPPGVLSYGKRPGSPEEVHRPPHVYGDSMRHPRSVRRGPIRDTPRLVNRQQSMREAIRELETRLITRQESLRQAVRELERKGHEAPTAEDLVREVPEYVPARDIPRYVEYTRHPRSESRSPSPPRGASPKRDASPGQSVPSRRAREAPWRQSPRETEVRAAIAATALPAERAQSASQRGQGDAAASRASTPSRSVRVYDSNVSKPSTPPRANQMVKTPVLLDGPSDLSVWAAPAAAPAQASSFDKRGHALSLGDVPFAAHKNATYKTPSLTVLGGGSPIKAPSSDLGSAKPGFQFACLQRKSPKWGLLPRAELEKRGLTEEPPLPPPATLSADVPFGLLSPVATRPQTSWSIRPSTVVDARDTQGVMALARAAVHLEQEIRKVGTPVLVTAGDASKRTSSYATLGLQVRALPRPQSQGDMKTSPRFSVLRSPREVFHKLTGSTSSPALPPRIYVKRSQSPPRSMP